MGRPVTYSAEVAEKVLSEVSEGKTLRETCRKIGTPESTVRRWVLDDREGFAARYAHAKELQVECWADELREIADDGSNDWMTIQRGGESVEVENREVVNRSRLRIDTLKWLMSKITPKKYADKTVSEVTGVNGGPLTVTWQKPDGA